MPIPLDRLRHDLDRLSRRRSTLRRGMVAAIVGLVLAAATVIAFALDFLVDLRPVPRAISLMTIIVAAVALVIRFVRPWMSPQETATDVALDVQGRFPGISDLVAAMQFQSSDDSGWGSPLLKQTVISTVDEAGRDLNLLEHFSWKPLLLRIAQLAIAVAGIVLVASFYPDHTRAFLRRLTLANVSYPTRTVITSVAVNGTPIDFEDDQTLRMPAGNPLRFTVSTGGVRPASGGRIFLTGDDGGSTSIALQSPAATNDESAIKPASTAVSDQHSNVAAHSDFIGTLEGFRQPLTFVVQLGDAESPPRRIEIVPRPTLTLELLPKPPAYAKSELLSPPPPGVRTAYVLEGSAVEIRVHAANKPLDRVTVSVDQPLQDRKASQPAVEPPAVTDPQPKAITLTSSADGRTWTLDPSTTVLENIRQPISFTIHATDRDGLSPAEPMTGNIRLRTDHPPRVAASAVVRHVVPTARPQIYYGASDEFGLKSLRAKLAVTHADGSVETAVMSLPLDAARPREYQGRHALDLSPLKLAKGDRVAVTVEAEDARGDRPGETASAEPVVLEVTDRVGLLSTLLDADEQSADRLDDIIRRELGIGENQ